MTGHDRLLDEVARLLKDFVTLREELVTLRKVTDGITAEADALADLAVERYRTIQTLEARCARLQALNDSMQRQVIDLAVRR
jgi:hypothetical protein